MPEMLQFEVAKLHNTQHWGTLSERVERVRQHRQSPAFDERRDPIKVRPDMGIADGHHRVECARQEGRIHIWGFYIQWPSTPRVKVRKGGKTYYLVDPTQKRR